MKTFFPSQFKCTETGMLSSVNVSVLDEHSRLGKLQMKICIRIASKL